MNGFVCSRAETVPRPFTNPCCKFRDARRTPCRPRSTADFSTRSVDQTPYRSPPLLLPAPGANSFNVTASAPDLSHLRHLVRSSASKAGRSNPDSGEAAAGYSDQLHTLRRDAGPGSKACLKCKDTFEMYCFPASTGSSDGRYHYCRACKADVSRKNNTLVGESMWTPTVNHKRCTGCGVQRLSAWYNKGPGSTGLQYRCIPCTALYDRQRVTRCQQAWDSKDPITAKMCRKGCKLMCRKGCKLTLPADSFTADVRCKDGYQCKCRDCRQVQYAARDKERLERLRNQTLVFAKGTERICTHCRVEKPWAKFGKRDSSMSGIHSICKQCVNTKKVQRYKFRKLQVLSD